MVAMPKGIYRITMWDEYALVVIVVNGYDYVIGSRTGLRAMLGAVVLVLLLACAGTAAGATWVDASVDGMGWHDEDG